MTTAPTLFDDWEPDGGQREPDAGVAVPEEVSAVGSDPSEQAVNRVADRAAVPRSPVGGGGGRRVRREPAGARVAGRRVPSPEEWGREQAARAPRWTAGQRAHAAGMFGLALPDPDGSSPAS